MGGRRRAEPDNHGDGIGEIGPGREYYLDMLVATRDGSPKLDFDDYYPAMKSCFDELPISD